MKINPTPHFKRAYKFYKKKHFPMDKVSECIVAIQQNNQEFLKRHKDHQYSSGIREMHIDRQYNDDWLLFYSFDKLARNK